MDDLLIGARIEWTSDRVNLLSHIQPRHIGRVCTMTVFTTDDPDNYDSYDVIGTLEGRSGQMLQVSGVEYDWAQVKDFRIYRRKVA